MENAIPDSLPDVQPSDNKTTSPEAELSAPARQRLLEAAKTPGLDLLYYYGNTEEHGFKEETVEQMRDKFGLNKMSQHEGESILKRLISAFINPFTAVLFALACISFFTDFAFVSPEDRELTTVVIILTMVFISGTLRFVQEYRSDKAAERLKAMVKTTTNVLRAEQGKIEIPLEDVVVGDIISLAAGDMVPADVRILSCKDLFISQSALTGESEPVEKFSATRTFDHNEPLHLDNLAFIGTNVISGTATCLVIAVGDSTIFGSLARTTAKVVTSFEKGVNSVSWVLIRFMMVMVPVVLFLNGYTKGDWLQAFLFALSVAVGLTPEMLPMIVTTNLAKGAVRMARKKTVIKKLDSIQNFGAMDILCTDKTGTLTQDNIVLERYLNIHGDQDIRVLRHAFANSYFQTGLKNLMDVAILKHAEDTGIRGLKDIYVKVDEIPFDFNRRRMSVVIRDTNGKTQLITKGAVEEMLDACAYTEYQGQVEVLSPKVRQDILNMVQRLNDDGLRVLAVAHKNSPAPAGAFSVQDEKDMVLMGYLAFLDPPKETAAAAIRALNEHGVKVKVLTGDNDAVTRSVCRMVGLPADEVILGTDIESMDDAALSEVVERCNIFAKLSPDQKRRIIASLRAGGHVVGFLGDGINDAPAMRESDVGISVDSAVDVAKESADIILLEKSLMVLEEGVVEGRKTFANIIKYIKMTASSNFGNMFSVLAASAFLPFLPMLPLQILILNLIYDISCISVPWDNVDEDYLRRPRKWDAKSIGSFMLWIGPTSSVFDITTYLLMFFVICPAVLGGVYGATGVDNVAFAALFHTGWFVESLWSQTLVIHMIRTPKIPFLQSRASFPVLIFTSAGIALGTLIPYTGFGSNIGMTPLPAVYYAWLAATLAAYMLLVTLLKKIYAKKYGELL
ncbi:MAG: magnesium-translocating P-type ATPase [Alphaproteobacteria bacterium]|nr:magnesium-translocating P-type ATPase [Alphaproteobacteria bacterium]